MLSTCKKLSRWQIVFQQLKQQGLQMEKNCKCPTDWLPLTWPGHRYGSGSGSVSARLQINSKIIVFVFVTLEFAACRKTFIMCLHLLPIFRVASYNITSGRTTTEGRGRAQSSPNETERDGTARLSVSIARWEILIKIFASLAPEN